MLSRFHLIPERYGQTDRQTDRFAISRVSMLMRDKNVQNQANRDIITAKKIQHTRVHMLVKFT